VDLVVEVGLWHPRARHMAAAVFEPFDAGLSVFGRILRNWSVASGNETTASSRGPRILRRLSAMRGAFRTTSLLMPSGSPRQRSHKRSSTGSRPARPLERSDESRARRRRGWPSHIPAHAAAGHVTKRR
jgi:hypothetical protein